MTDLYYRLGAGEPAVTPGSLLLIASWQWMTTPDHRVTITHAPAGVEGWAYGTDQHGHQVRVFIRQPGMLAGSHPRLR